LKNSKIMSRGHHMTLETSKQEVLKKNSSPDSLTFQCE